MSISKKSLAYVSQEAWILNKTVKENILMGQQYEEDWYRKVVMACALESDLCLLPEGDETIIGAESARMSVDESV